MAISTMALATFLLRDSVILIHRSAVLIALVRIAFGSRAQLLGARGSRAEGALLA